MERRRAGGELGWASAYGAHGCASSSSRSLLDRGRRAREVRSKRAARRNEGGGSGLGHRGAPDPAGGGAGVELCGGSYNQGGGVEFRGEGEQGRKRRGIGGGGHCLAEGAVTAELRWLER